MKKIVKVNKVKVALRNKFRQAARKFCDFALADEPIEENDILEEEIVDETEPVEPSRKKMIKDEAKKIVKVAAVAAIIFLAKTIVYKKGYREGYNKSNKKMQRVMEDLWHGRKVKMIDSSTGRRMFIKRV